MKICVAAPTENFALCANIFARGSCERAPVALLAKCELQQCKQNLHCGAILTTRAQKKERHPMQSDVSLFSGDPWENRTPVTAVKGRCLSRLTNGPMVAGIGFEPMTYRV